MAAPLMLTIGELALEMSRWRLTRQDVEAEHQ